MRIAITGTSNVAVLAARMLVDHGHDVIIIDEDKSRLDDLSEELDCAFLHGDGSRPSILSEAGPEQTDVLMCISGNDQDNIIASLVGRSLGFKSVITRISHAEFSAICTELGLELTINPNETTAQRLADMVEHPDHPHISHVLKNDARFFVFVARDEDAGMADDLDLPGQTRVLYLYRDNKLVAGSSKLEIEEGDEVVLITVSESIGELRERWPSSEQQSAD